MAEILLEGRDCETCGTEVRKGALFCYHCGASVAPDVVVTTDIEGEKFSDARLSENTNKSETENEKITGDTEKIKETDESENTEDIVEPETAVKEISEDEIIEDDAEVNKNEPVISENKAKTSEEEIKIQDDMDAEKEEKPKLKTAAAMRRTPKRIQKKRVEIVWDEPQSPPNIWFLIATLIFALLSVGLWFVAKHLG